MQPDPAREAMLTAVLNGDVTMQDRLLANTRMGGRGQPPFPPDRGGGGRPDDMEPRLAKLEAHMEHVMAQLAGLGTVPERLARIEERVGHLPTKDELGAKLRNYLAVAGALFAILGTVIGIAFKIIGR